jgi:hypothetical protein
MSAAAAALSAPAGAVVGKKPSYKLKIICIHGYK